MRVPVGRVVVLEVAAALPRLEPADRRDAIGVVAAGGLEHDARHVVPLAPVLGADDAPAVTGEPVVRSAVDDARDGVLVDPEVVPVEEEHEVRETEPPRGVPRLVRRARREAALAFDREDLHLFAARDLQRDRLAGRRRHAVARRTGVPFEEERLAAHLGVAGEATVAAQEQQVLPGQREFPVVREREARIPGALVPEAHRLVQRRERRVDERHGVARRKHEPVAEGAPGMEDVPAHPAREHEREKDVHLRPRPAGVTALAVVQRQVDELVDDVLRHFPHREGSRRVRRSSLGMHRASHRGFCSTIAR